MTTFTYKAKKNTAETVSGEISANSQDEAIDLINQLGLLPVSVKPSTAAISSSKGVKPKRISGKQLFVFFNQIAKLLKSGISLIRALIIVAEQTQNTYLKSIITQISSGIKNGRSFSDCLADFPNVFSMLFVTMVQAGEESGNLEKMLLEIAIYQKKQDELFGKVKNAMVYPLFMFGVGIVTVYFILTFVLPKMSGLFENAGENLPLPTEILLYISAFLSKGWIFILIGGLCLFVASKRWSQTVPGQLSFSRISLSFPFFGDLILKTELTRFSRTLQMLLKSGVGITQALKVATPVLKNIILKAEFEICRKDLMAGGSLGNSLQKSKNIPLLMGHLISVGEESGSLNDVLIDISEGFEQETNEKIKMMTTLIEPIMILIIGSVIGFIVFAMLLPIFQMDVMSQ